VGDSTYKCLNKTSTIDKSILLSGGKDTYYKVEGTMTFGGQVVKTASDVGRIKNNGSFSAPATSDVPATPSCPAGTFYSPSTGGCRY